MDAERDAIAKAIAEALSMTMPAAQIAAQAALDALAKFRADRLTYPADTEAPALMGTTSYDTAAIKRLVRAARPFYLAALELDAATLDGSEIRELPVAMMITAGDLREMKVALNVLADSIVQGIG